MNLYSHAESWQPPDTLEELAAQWDKLEDHYSQLSNAQVGASYSEGSFAGKSIGFSICAAQLRATLAKTTPRCPTCGYTDAEWLVSLQRLFLLGLYLCARKEKGMSRDGERLKEIALRYRDIKRKPHGGVGPAGNECTADQECEHDCREAFDWNAIALDIVSPPRLQQLLAMLDATTVEAAVENLEHHFGKDARIIDMLLSARTDAADAYARGRAALGVDITTREP